jgi:hypothetical protein
VQVNTRSSLQPVCSFCTGPPPRLRVPNSFLYARGHGQHLLSSWGSAINSEWQRPWPEYQARQRGAQQPILAQCVTTANENTATALQQAPGRPFAPPLRMQSVRAGMLEVLAHLHLHHGRYLASAAAESMAIASKR